MSSVMVEPGTVQNPGEPIRYQEFEYRPIPPLVPIAAIFVLLSLTAYAWDVLVVIPLVGTVLAFLAWRQVARGDGAYSGGGVARLSAIILPIILLTSLCLHAYLFATEVPPGFQRVNFATDISNKGFINDQGQPGIHPDVQKLTENPIFVKGYMYPTRRTTDLESFVLCRDSGDCCFGGQPKITDMIYVEMPKGKGVDFLNGLVSVAGQLKVSPTAEDSGLNPVYKLECAYFSGAKTSY